MNLRRIAVIVLGFFACTVLTVRGSRVTGEAFDSLPAEIDDKVQDTLDEIIQDLEDKYGTFDPTDFWHSYVFGTGNQNREILHVRNVEQVEVEGDYIQWKYARLGLKHYLIGLKQRQITVRGLDFQTVDSIDVVEDLDAITVFTKWNEVKNYAEMVILTVSSEPRLYLHLFENDKIKSITSFPLHYAVKAIEFCHVRHSSQVVLIPKDAKTDIDIYNVEVHNNTQVWFFQRISARDDNTNVVVYDSDMLESVIAVSGGTHLFIHTFDPKAGMFAVSQDVSLPNACSTLFSFTVAYQHYIGCVPVDPDLTVRFVSFNYNTNEYVLEDEDNNFKDTKTTSVYPVAVPDYTDQHFILIRNVDGDTRIMVYHGREAGFEMEYNCTNSTCPNVSDLSKGVGFRNRDYSAFIFPSGDQGGNSIVWLITKEILDTRSPLLDESRQLYNNYNELSKRFQIWEQSIAGIGKVLNDSVKVDQPNVVTGSWDVDRINSKNLLGDGKKSQLGAVNNLQFVGSQWTDEDFETDIKHIYDQLNYLRRNVSIAQSELAYAIMANNGTVQHVTAAQQVTGKFHTQNLTTQKILTASLRGDIEPAAFLNSFVLKSNDVRVSGGLIFANPVKVSALNASTINGVSVSHIARYSQENVFECPVQFTNGIHAIGNVLSPTINGVSVPDELMLVSNISGVNFIDGFVISNNTNSKGEYSVEKVLLKSTSQIVESQIHFDHLVITSPLNVTNIDNYDVNSFLSSVVTSDYSGLITGRKSVMESVHAKSLNIGSTWNNVSFPNGFVRNNQNRVVLNLPTMLNFLTVKKVILGGTINSVNINDLVTRNTRQDLSTSWTFIGPVAVNRDITVSGLVDGVDMRELGNKATLNDLKDVHIYADVVFERDIIVETLQVKNDVNGKNLEEIFSDFLQFNGTNCHVPGVTTVLSDIVLDSVIIEDDHINGQPLSKFFLVNGDQNITEDITISEDSDFASLTALKTYDGVSLATLLDDAVRLTGTNKIGWKAEFEHIICTGEGMMIGGSINGFSDFGSNVAVTSGRPSQKFLSPIEFEAVDFDSAVIERDFNITDGQKIGMLDIRQWFSRRLTLSGREFITSPVFIDGSVTGLHDIYTPIINNVSLETLSLSTFRTNALNQAFSKHVTFQNGLEVSHGNVTFDSTVSGYDLKHIHENAFPLNSREVLELHGLWHFESIVVTNKLDVEGETCGVDLRELASTTVRKDALDIQISSPTNFRNVTVEKLLQVRSINGKDTEDLMTTNTNQTIGCNFEAKKNVKVTGNLVTDGHINGVSTEVLSKTYSHEPNNVHTISAEEYKFNHNLTMDKLVVRGTIQGKDFSNTAHTQHLIKVSDVGLRFTGVKTFTSLVTIAKDSTTTSYNGLAVESLQFQTLDDDIVVTSPSIFHGNVNSRIVQSNDGDITAEIVNGFKWDDILTNSIPLGENIDPHHLRNLVFDSVIVGGHLTTRTFQGHRFEDFIRLDSKDQNLGDVTVRKIKITGPTVRVGGLFNGVKLEDEFDQTIMVGDADTFELTGKKSFLGTLTVEGDVTCFGPTFQDNVIDITQPFTISNSVEFANPIVIENGLSVSQTVQNTTIDEIMADALTNGESGEEQVISGKWEFTNGLTFTADVVGPGELKNFDLQSLITETEYKVRAAEEKIESQKLTFRQECQQVHDVTHDLLYNPMKLDAFDKHQTIPLTQQAEKMVIVQSSGKLVMLTSLGCGIIRYDWNNKTELFHQDVLPTLAYNMSNFGKVRDWQSTMHEDDGLMIFTTEPSPCSGLARGLHYTVMDATGTFSPVHTLDLGHIKTFRVISDLTNENTAIFALKNDTLEIFTWNSHNGKFFRLSKKLGVTHHDGMDVALHLSGVSILLTAPSEIAVLHFNWIHHDLSFLAKNNFDASNKSPTLFDNFGSLYALVLGRSSQFSTSTFSTIQLFSLVEGGHLVKLQPLPLGDSYITTAITFSHQTFLAILSKTYGLNIYKFAALAGLQRLNANPIKIFNGIAMANFDVQAWDFSAPRPFIAILTRTTVEIFHSNVYGDSLDYASQSMCRIK